MHFYRRPWTRCQIATGAIVLAIGIFLIVFVPIKLKSTIYETFSIASPSSDFVKNFIERDPKGASVYNSYYVYHIENPHEVTVNGADPIVRETGPYTYRQNTVHRAEELAWRADGTLEYIERCEYTFDPSRSAGSESDIVTTVNLGYVGALNKARDSEVMRYIVETTIKRLSAPLFINLTIAEILWGYNNTILEALSQLDKSINPTIALQVKSDFNRKDLLPGAVITGGPSTDGLYQHDKNEVRQITMWKGMKKSGNFWGSPFANMFNGTDGTTFHPYIDEDDFEPYAFVDSLYRSMQFARCGTMTKDGVRLLCLTLREELLLSGEHNPNNKAFYMKTTGILPLPPAAGQPIYVSLPHYYRGNLSDPLLNKVQFTPHAPQNNRYDTRLYVEPFTGQLFEAHKRLQINTFLEPGITTLNPNTTHTYLPIAWIDQYPDIPDTTVTKFKLFVYLPYYGSIVAGSVFIAVGVGLVVVAVLRCTCWVSAKHKAMVHNNFGHEYLPLNRGESTSLATVNS